MKIGFIARGLTKGGVTRYIENILSILNNLDTSDTFVLFTDKKEFIDEYKNIKVVYIKNSNKFFWDYIKILPALYREKLDVVIYPKNIIPITHIIYNFKKINIIHDLAYFSREIGEYKFWDTIYMKAFMKLSCIISNKVVAVSKSTKNDIEIILKIQSKEIVVVHEGVGNSFKKIIDQNLINKTLLKFNIKTPFIFYCGSLSPRKNMLRALLAFNEIKDLIPHNIYIASGQSWHDKKVREYIREKLFNRVFLIGHIADEELIHLYSCADLYLYLSIYEGFGLPILEAQACGCPVITSKISSMPEVAGVGAILVDPYNIEEIAEKIQSIANDKKLKTKLVSAGYINLKRFSWSKCTKEILEICKNNSL